jgi:ABC-type thiamine transport system ATPase subunit
MILIFRNYCAGLPEARAACADQRRRLAIGRALVRDAEVFLFDEPLVATRRAASGRAGRSRSSACTQAWALQ